MQYLSRCRDSADQLMRDASDLADSRTQHERNGPFVRLPDLTEIATLERRLANCQEGVLISNALIAP